MLDLRALSHDLDALQAALRRRGGDFDAALEKLQTLSRTRRACITETETLQAERNAASKAMAQLDRNSESFAAQREALRALGDRAKAAEAQLKEAEAELEALALRLPNLPHESVPDGASEADNVVLNSWGETPTRDFEAKDHVTLGEAQGWLDFKRAATLSGARFAVLRGAAARLERALVHWMVDHHTAAGYEEYWLPVILNESALLGTGQLPKFAEDQFELVRTEGDEQRRFLSPTAEVALTCMHRDEILEASSLPRRYTAYAACFRSEAGSYGRDTRGMIRQHQFDKVELVHLCEAGQGLAELERLRTQAESVLQALQLHYRTVELCSGDLGFAAAKTYDLEVWLPGQSAYREISSCSWCESFQARRLKLRCRPAEGGKPRLAETLNGSGLAIGRTLVAILEQYQDADGRVRIPEVLRGYFGGASHLTPAHS